MNKTCCEKCRELYMDGEAFRCDDTTCLCHKSEQKMWPCKAEPSSNRSETGMCKDKNCITYADGVCIHPWCGPLCACRGTCPTWKNHGTVCTKDDNSMDEIKADIKMKSRICCYLCQEPLNGACVVDDNLVRHIECKKLI